MIGCVSFIVDERRVSIGAAIEITRTERTAEALRWFAAQSNDGPQIGRLLALAPILEGQPRLCVRAA